MHHSALYDVFSLKNLQLNLKVGAFLAVKGLVRPVSYLLYISYKTHSRVYL